MKVNSTITITDLDEDKRRCVRCKGGLVQIVIDQLPFIRFAYCTICQLVYSNQ